MMSIESPDIPRNMQRALRRFERRRGAHSGRLPIPERLWAAAANRRRTLEQIYALGNNEAGKELPLRTDHHQRPET